MDSIGKAAGTAVGSLRQSTLTSPGSSAQLAETAKIARVLLGWVDPREANDPEIFTAGLIAVLQDYPVDVQRIVADPRSAVLARFREVWPFVERVRRACEDIHSPTRRRLERERAIAEQLAERERNEKECSNHPTSEELQAKYGTGSGLL